VTCRDYGALLLGNSAMLVILMGMMTVARHSASWAEAAPAAFVMSGVCMALHMRVAAPRCLGWSDRALHSPFGPVAIISRGCAVLLLMWSTRSAGEAPSVSAAWLLSFGLLLGSIVATVLVKITVHLLEVNRSGAEAPPTTSIARIDWFERKRQGGELVAWPYLLGEVNAPPSSSEERERRIREIRPLVGGAVVEYGTMSAQGRSNRPRSASFGSHVSLLSLEDPPSFEDYVPWDAT